jgi:hypothetical protein
VFDATVDKPNSRAGAPLLRFAQEAKKYADIQRQARRKVKIHFLSEGSPSDFATFAEVNPNAIMHLAKSITNREDAECAKVVHSWQPALDLMTESQVLETREMLTRPHSTLLVLVLHAL